MNWWDLALRLFILCAYALTMVVCFVRVFITPDVRARVGNVAFGMSSGVAWFYQSISLNLPAVLSTYLLGAAAVACLSYLVVLARTEL